jgi:anti-sigma regulatory factor (Ser/Thr protein kinase)
MHPYVANGPVPAGPRPETFVGPQPAFIRVGRQWRGPGTRETSLTLGPVETAPKCARGTLIASLKVWGLSHLQEAGAAITSELVTNAIAASHQAAPSGTDPGDIVLRLTVRAGELCIRVWDPDPTPPPRDQALPDDDAEHGRGLFIVSALSKRWGWYPGRNGGKHVWAALPLDPQENR